MCFLHQPTQATQYCMCMSHQQPVQASSSNFMRLYAWGGFWQILFDNPDLSVLVGWGATCALKVSYDLVKAGMVVDHPQRAEPWQCPRAPSIIGHPLSVYLSPVPCMIISFFLQEWIKAIAFLGCKWLWEPSYICRTWPVGECSSILRAMHPMLVHP